MKAIVQGLIGLTVTVLLVPEVSGQLFRKNRVNTSANFTVQQLAPGVWAAIHNTHYGKAICNAGIIDLGNKTLVFDPFMNPDVAAELKLIARQLTRKPVSVVVNSHHHNDHIRGNQAFLPNATIISTRITRDLIEKTEPEEQEWEKRHTPTLLQALRKRMANASEAERGELPYWIGYYEGVVESTGRLYTALPDLTFEDSLWIEGSKLSVKLVERRNGHTASDAVLLIPTLGIAFMGDLLCAERHPWISDGDVQSWREALRVFYEDTLYHTYLPGHGKVSGKAELKLLYDYLGDVQDMCRAAETDSAQSALLSGPIPAPYSRWFLSRFYHPNLQYLLGRERIRQNQDTLPEPPSSSRPLP